MKKTIFLIAVVVQYLSANAVTHEVYRPTDNSLELRFFSLIDFVTTMGRCKGCPRRCLDDKSVIDGYCCGCARVSDFLPVNCQDIPGHCPSDGRRLCKNYDYMLDCCCP